MSEKLYAERDIVEQGDYYSRHTSAMTGEGLHSKSDIAAELAHRDIELTRLQSEVERLRGRVAELERLAEDALNVAENELGLDFVMPHTETAMKELFDFGRKALSVGEAGEYESAWLLRKQAEAVEAFALHISCMASDESDDWWSVSKNPLEQIEDAKEYAKYLHRKADEAEKTGG